MTYNSPD